MRGGGKGGANEEKTTRREDDAERRRLIITAVNIVRQGLTRVQLTKLRLVPTHSPRSRGLVPQTPSRRRRGGRRSARARVGRAPRADGSDPPTFAADASRSGATRVVRLEGGPRGAVAYVVGASHVLGEDAARDVFALVGRHDPDVVLLELCAERAPAALRAAVAATRRAGPPTGPPEAPPATAAAEDIAKYVFKN